MTDPRDSCAIVGKVLNGRFMGDKAKLQAFFAHAENQIVSCVWTIGRKKATHPQFKWYRGVALPILAEHLGYDKHERDELHESILGICYGWKEDKLTGRQVPAHRTRENNVKEMSEFGEWFQRYCATEHGVIVPDPQKPDGAEAKHG